MVATCNIGSLRHLVGEEHFGFICAIHTGSEGRSARSTAVYTGTIHDLVPLPACIENSWSFSCECGSNAMQR